MANSYKTSEGERIKKSVIDRRIREAKAAKISEQLDQYGYNFCEGEECERDYTRLDCAHVISVDDCQKSGRTEQSWDIDNIKILCRNCHNKQHLLKTKR